MVNQIAQLYIVRDLYRSNFIKEKKSSLKKKISISNYFFFFKILYLIDFLYRYDLDNMHFNGHGGLGMQLHYGAPEGGYPQS